MNYGIVSFLGKFHPLLVHLPIGMLAIAILFGFLSTREGYSYLKGANHIVLLLSAVAATLSCVTGWILSEADGLTGELITWHQWMGISLAAVSWLAFLMHSRNAAMFKGLLIVLGLLLVATGHLGGSLTHGEDFLNPPPLADWFVAEGAVVDPIELTPETLAYEAVDNIVDRKCKSCHGPGKQKGELRLDSPEGILKGGENGQVIVAGLPGESPLVEHITLPLDSDDHMPPKEKSQLTKAEINLLIEWVATGASFDKTLNQLAWSDSLIREFNESTIKNSITGFYSYVPQQKVEPADAALLARLDTLGVAVAPVGGNSNYLSLSFFMVPDDYLDKAFAALPMVSTQCIWLDVAGKPLEAQHLEAIGELRGLTRLALKGCQLSDSLLLSLDQLSGLEYLNMVNNQVTAVGISHLKANTKLKSLFLYQTSVVSADTVALRAIFPEAKIDMGGYDLPVLESDTTAIIY